MEKECTCRLENPYKGFRIGAHDSLVFTMMEFQSCPKHKIEPEIEQPKEH